MTEHDFVDPPLNRETGRLAEEAARQGRSAVADRGRDRDARLPAGRSWSCSSPRPSGRSSTRVAGMSVRDIVRGLVDAVDPDSQAAVEAADSAEPAAAVRSGFWTTRSSRSPPTRSCAQRILELRATHDRVIDEVSVDVLLDAHGVVDTARARSIVESWRAYLDEHRDEITAIQLLTEATRTTDRLRRHPGARRPDQPTALQLDTRPHLGRLRGAGVRRRAAQRQAHPHRPGVAHPVSPSGSDDELIPYADACAREVCRLAGPAGAGRRRCSAASDRWWFDRMVEVIAVSAGVSRRRPRQRALRRARRRRRRHPRPRPERGGAH
ncbi:MAG: hypothetical protein WKF73_01275 [Nocardioidaceae bacterium]